MYVCEQNMVGPGEVDDELEAETADECSKYGKVIKCLIFEVSVNVVFKFFMRLCNAISILRVKWIEVRFGVSSPGGPRNVILGRCSDVPMAVGVGENIARCIAQERRTRSQSCLETLGKGREVNRCV